MAKPQPPALERMVRDARRQHRAAKYPGDLAADLGLDTQATPMARPARSPRRLWLTRWGPACAAAAVLLGAVVWWQTAAWRSPAAPDGGNAVVESVPTPGPDASQLVVHESSDASPAIAELIAAVPPGGLEEASHKFDASVARATQQAEKELSDHWTGHHAPPAPAFARPTYALSPGSIPTLGLPNLTLPRGYRFAVPSLSTLRKELS